MLKMNMVYKITILTIIMKLSSCQTDNCDNVDIQKLCLDQEVCDKCLQAHECCNWCFDQDYSSRSCNTLKHLSACSPDKIEHNHNATLEIPEFGEIGNLDFTKISSKTDFENIIQIKPQHINIRLRKDVPMNFTFTYKPAENYPLDLYYLGDLSVSMKDSLEIFKTLGTDLPDNLTTLTQNYRLAYGSFMDKTGMPFYVDGICTNLGGECEKGYLFRHRLDFTRDTRLFTEKIIKSKITANLDDLDGALDAIWQILTCPKQIGWSRNSRKIILLPTDSLLHMAGDGKLVGAVLRPKQICLLDENGLHKEPLKYDYPSIGEIDRLLKDNKVNIIFAVKDQSKKDYYIKLTKDLVKDSTFVGELETDSSNILQLITRGFYNFANQVSFSVNTSSASHLNVKFYGDCENIGIFNETNICYGIGTNPIEFKVEVSLKGNAPRRHSDILYIEEKNIHEKVTLNITYGGVCTCENYSGHKDCKNGEFVCGSCICEDDWAGELCDRDCNSHDTMRCRLIQNDIVSEICSGNGDCICGACDCDFPFQGKFCQYECPISNDLICGGPSQGACSQGKCICEKGFKYEDCSCATSTDNCKFFGLEDFCSNKGKCECNQCHCFEGYSGEYCEINKDNNTLCEIYRPYVEGAVLNNTLVNTDGNVKINVDVKDGIIKDVCGDNMCQILVFEGSNRCTVDFCYDVRDDGEIHLLASKSCILRAEFKILSTALAVFFAVLIGGIIAILISKCRIYRLEQAEYKKFANEQKSFNEMNPLYKNPYMEYRNPLHTET